MRISSVTRVYIVWVVLQTMGWPGMAHAAAPVLDPPANMVVVVGATADQLITATDPDGDPLLFSKAAGPTFMTVTTTTPGSGTATGNIHLAPVCPASGTYGGTVSASDGTLSDSKPLTITIAAVNRAPFLNPPANMTVFEGATADQSITASDPDCAPLAFFGVGGPTFMTVTTSNPGPQPATGNIHLAPGFFASGSYTASVSASDGSLSDTKSFTITVNDVNRPPFLNQPANMTVTEGSTANQAVTATDPDGQALSFSKATGPTFMAVTTTNATTGNIHLAPGFSDSGTYNATVQVTDGLLTDSKSLTITVNNSCIGVRLNQPANMTVNVNATADQTITGFDGCDNLPLTFFKVSGPTFLTVTTVNATTGNLHLAPGALDAGTFVATVGASNGTLSDTKSLMIVVNGNRAPILDPIANMAVPPGSTADQAISGSDPDGDALTFSKAAGPTFMTVTTTSPTTGNVHVAPAAAEPAGTYSATARASDGSLTSDRSFVIVICLGCNRAPVLAQPSDMTVDEGATADQAITATDADGNAITFSKVSGPLFMTVTTTSPGMGIATGNIHLTPGFADGGSYGATVRATDGALSDAKSLGIAVNPVCSGQPRANAGGPYQGFLNVPIEFDGSGSSDPNGGALSYLWDFGDGTTGTGVKPLHTYTALGTYIVTLTVMGTCGTGSDSTIVNVVQACESIAFTQGGNRTIRLNSGRPKACVQIEPQPGCYQNEDVILSSIVMRYTGGAVTEIHAIADKTVVDSDTNNDGITEITACFRKEDLRQLFSGLPGGQSAPVVTLEGDLTTGGRFHATLELRVISGGGTVAVAVAVAPNPFNPTGTLTFTTARSGRAKVELFDVSGRLVRTILDEPSLAAGPHEVRIEGRGQRGGRLASGTYFIRGASVEGAFTKTITILK